MAETATQQKPSLTLVRSLKAAPEKVWRALTEPAGLAQWMGMANAPKAPDVEADLRVGGRYRIVMHAPGGETHDVSGVYREIVPNRKLVYSWVWKSTPERESLVTLELRVAAGGTELTLKHEQFFDDEARKSHLQGWNACLDALERMFS